MIQNDKLDFTFKIKRQKDRYKVISNCSYLELDDVKDLKSKIITNHVLVARLVSEYSRYNDFVQKYEGTMGSMCTNSNFAENKAIWTVLKTIILSVNDSVKSSP